MVPVLHSVDDDRRRRSAAAVEGPFSPKLTACKVLGQELDFEFNKSWDQQAFVRSATNAGTQTALPPGGLTKRCMLAAANVLGKRLLSISLGVSCVHRFLQFVEGGGASHLVFTRSQLCNRQAAAACIKES